MNTPTAQAVKSRPTNGISLQRNVPTVLQRQSVDEEKKPTASLDLYQATKKLSTQLSTRKVKAARRQISNRFSRCRNTQFLHLREYLRR